MAQAELRFEQTERQIEQTERQIQRAEREGRRLSREGERFSREGREDRAESRAHRIDMRRQWGELSQRLGTMAEDLVAPSVPRILRTVIGCPEDRIDSMAVRVRRRSSTDRSVVREFDVVATCSDVLMINETKTRLTPVDVTEFAAMLPTVRDYFPEHTDKRVIGALASLYVDESLVRHGERQGLIILGFGEDVMDVLNTPGFVPREF